MFKIFKEYKEFKERFEVLKELELEVYKKQEKDIKNLMYIVKSLKYEIDNPKKYEVSQKTKYGTCVSNEVVQRYKYYKNDYFPHKVFDRKYIFKKDVSTVEIWHSDIIVK